MDAVDKDRVCPSCGARVPDDAPYCPECGESLSTPRTLADGRFALHRLIGKGGMGRVFQATDTRLSSERAIKMLHVPEDLPEDQRARQTGRLIQEARASMALSDDTHHIVRVFDVGESEGEQPYLVMEYLEGQSLASALADGPLTVERALVIARGIADALACAHRRGMVHRDLKPDNVMLIERNGEPDFVKLLDFGLVKLDGAEVKTQPGIALGTIQYMAPEQLRGVHIDARVDVFAFGSVLYEMLSGVRANPGSSQAELFAVLLDTGITPIETLCPDLEPRIANLVSECVQLEPESRPADGQAIGALLETMNAPATLGSTSLDTEASDADSSQTASLERGLNGQKTSRSWLWSGLAIALLVGALAAWWTSHRVEQPQTEPDISTTSVSLKPASASAPLVDAATSDAGTPAAASHSDDLPVRPKYKNTGDPSGWHYTGDGDEHVFAGLVVDLAFGPQTRGRIDRWAAMPSVVRYWLSLHFATQRPTQGKGRLDIAYPEMGRLRGRLISPVSLKGLGLLWSSKMHGAIFESVNCSQLQAGDKLVTTRWSMRGYTPGECLGASCPTDLARILKQGSRRGERITLKLGVERSETDSGKTSELTVGCTVRP